jgi:segregation and condensation protein A
MNNNIEQITEQSPYEVILTLLAEDNRDITTVSLSAITERFLGYIDALDREASDEIADFLTVAAKLLLIKSSLLLPTFQVIEEDDEVSLTDRLKLYERFQAASDYIAEAWESDRLLGVHPAITVEPEVCFTWAENITTDALRTAMQRVITKNKPPKPLPKTSIDKTVSLKETISRLRTVLKKGTKTSFWKHADKTSKTSVIIHFLALLELTKLGSVAPSQQSHFTDITLEAR